MTKQALVVDDHPLVRDGIRDLLRKAFPTIDFQTSAGAENVLNEVCNAPWSFVVLDMNLPGQNGIDIIRKARRCCPNIPIIVFSMFSEQRYAARALRAGAVAYLSKDRRPPDLIQAVKAALEIGPVKRRVKAAAPQPLLSDREVQVLGLLVNGRTRQQIAEQLHISEKTVSTYRTRLMVKLEVRNLVELFRYAVDEGLVD